MRLQVDDGHGTAVVYLLPPTITRRQADALAEIVDAIPPVDRAAVLAQLIRDTADEQAYQRVCTARGLLL